MRVAHIKTTKGILEVKLFDKSAPLTVDNFCKLAESGFYDGLTFFKHIPKMLIQTGCPNNNGTGGAGYFIKCELNGDQNTLDYGVLAMAHLHRDTNSSQFFICLTEQQLDFIDGNHTCFGIVEQAGPDLLRKLQKGDAILGIEIETINEELMYQTRL